MNDLYGVEMFTLIPVFFAYSHAFAYDNPQMLTGDVHNTCLAEAGLARGGWDAIAQ